MAELSTDDGGGGKGKHQKKRAKKSSTKVDMTPMVDLAFLLLTFFMLAATFNKAKTMEITFPKDADDPTTKTKINEELATTFLVGKSTDFVYYYKGVFEDTTQLQKLAMTKDGIRKYLLKRNLPVDKAVKEIEERFRKGEIADSTMKRLRGEAKSNDKAPFVIVKTNEDSKYETIIDIVDELNICNIGKYGVIDITEKEEAALKAEEAK